jgi:hypothetical protein
MPGRSRTLRAPNRSLGAPNRSLSATPVPERDPGP